MSTDAIVMLKEDHVRIKRLFRKFEQAGEGAKKQKAEIVVRILTELTVHTYLENEVKTMNASTQRPPSSSSW